MKRLLCVTLSILLVCSVFTCTTLTAYGAVNSKVEVSAESNGITYNVKNDGTAEITGCAAGTKNLTIPKTIGGYKVTSVAGKAFENSSLSSLVFPDTIESIGTSILTGNKGVKKLTIPKSVKTMRGLSGGYKGALYNSSVETVVFENGIVSIPSQACHGAKFLTNVTIPATVKTIESEVFCECSALTNVSIPESVTTIGSCAFASSGLTSLTLPSKLETLGARVLAGNTAIKEVTIPKTVKTMKALDGGYKGALYNSSVENVVFEEGMRALPDYALNGATNLVNVTIPMRVKTIGSNAFENTNSDFTIHGYDGSAAHNYAKANKLNYVSLGVEPLDTTIQLAKTSATVYLTGTTKIKATVKNGVGKTIYRSTNTKVATVSAKGVVTAKKAGIAKITVTNNDVTKTFTVTVKKPSLNKTKHTLKKGMKFTLKIKGKIGKAQFKSSNKKVAIVSKNGKIFAKKKGNASIIVKTNGITLKCKLAVK